MPPKQRQALTDRSNMSLAAGDSPTELNVSKIRINGGTQMRAGLDDAAIQDYLATLIAQEDWGTWPFPPVVVYHDGSDYWLADGFHRLQALRSFTDGRDKQPTVPATVKSGTRRDAILHAAGANAEHGLRRTNADKRRAVETLLSDPEWAVWSDREIARRCRVSNQFVSNMRKELSVNDGQIDTARQVARGGKTYTMETRGIRDAAQVDKPAEPASEPKPARVVYVEQQSTSERTPSASPVLPASAPDLPDGYRLVHRPGFGWQWRREIAGGATLMGNYHQEEAAAAAEARQEGADRQARKAARTVYVEPQPTTEPEPSERPREYTITLDAEAYAALRTAVRHGALAMRMRGEVKERIKAAIEKAQYED